LLCTGVLAVAVTSDREREGLPGLCGEVFERRLDLRCYLVRES
jgi:hypothetical protein